MALDVSTMASRPLDHDVCHNASIMGGDDDNVLDVWRRKLDFLLSEQAKTSAAEAKFELEERIAEARAKIVELGGKTSGPTIDSASATSTATGDGAVAIGGNVKDSTININIGTAGVPPSQPTPEPEESEEDQQLEALIEQEAELRSRGENTTVIQGVIRDLKRNRREQKRPQLLKDAVLAGRFKLMERIGQGGFATVWKALDRMTKEMVAVKVLHAQYADDSSRLTRFFRGAREMSKLKHPSIVRVMEPKAKDQGHAFFVMEYIAGGDLRQAVLAGKLSLDERMAIVREVGEALADAHARGVIHRDVKPANILLDLDGRPRLTDFDLVTAADTTGGTRTGTGLGTFIYAAPEALHDAAEVEEPADVYGLGMTAVFALYGKALPPVVMRDAPGFAAELDAPSPWQEVIARAVEWKAEDRWPSIEDFCQALGEMMIAPKSSSEEPFDEGERPSWASDAGRDDFGLWASFKVGTVEQRARWIEPGSFLMGSLETEEGRYDREGPQHQVGLTEGFWLAETLCTQELWQEAMGENPSAYKGRSHPVENVSWHDCQEFLEALNERLPGLKAGLPSEAQWEYVCRAGTREPRYSPKLGEIAWFGDVGGPHPVGEKVPNPWGLYDMLGNVWEWCSDWHAAYSADPAVDPTGPTKGTYRVLRGGSWDDHARHVRAAARHWDAPGGRSSFLGFRLAPGQSRGAEVRGAESGGAVDRPRPGGSPARDEPATPGRRPVEISISDPEKRLFRWIDTPHDGRVELWRDIPAGEFWMGSPEGEGRDAERPRHHVKVTSGFQLCAVPVTNAQYAEFKPEKADMSKPNHPVAKVSWHDAMAFCEWLSEGFEWARGARLPTEEEWEYAARAGTETRYWSGDEKSDLDRVGWYDENSGRRTHAVGEKPANEWGLYDVHGNVWEWTLTAYENAAAFSKAYKGREAGISIDPADLAGAAATRGGERVIRGGSWFNSADWARSAYRDFWDPGDVDWFRGFRVLLPPGPRAGH